MTLYTIKNKQKNPIVFPIVLLTILTSQSTNASITDSIENALKFGQKNANYGQIKINVRYRYEQDDSKNSARKKADASTIRLRLGYLTPVSLGFQGFVEYESNQDFGANTYNSLRNSKNNFETIADPQEHELNQLWIKFTGIPDTAVKVGRQRIKINNSRFIGNVGWRQLESTYNAVLLSNTSLSNTTVELGYINQRQFITSTVQAMQTPFVNISYDFKGFGKLSTYSYLIDNNERHATSNQTYGLSFTGNTKVSNAITALYRLEYAYQKDYEQNPNQYEVDYFHLMGGAHIVDFTVKAGMEQLNGVGTGQRFQTPLATGHAFNGWSDQFLNTPDNGLRDIYGLITSKIAGVKLQGVYHDFTDDTGHHHYGTEWDFLMVKQFGKHYSLLAKYAYFNGARGRNDTQNFWLQASLDF